VSYTPPGATAVDFTFTPGAYTPPGSAAVTFSFGASGTTPAGTMAGALAITGEVLASHTVPTHTGTMAGALAIEGEAAGRHGTTGQAAATLTQLGAITAVHPRFELKGVVLDAGTPVDRRVRAYLRSTGALAYETDTTAGAFTIAAGWAVNEYYLIPVDLANDATDWAPPVANRVLSALKVDA
jgi:hypothetical protein